MVAKRYAGCILLSFFVASCSDHHDRLETTATPAENKGHPPEAKPERTNALDRAVGKRVQLDGVLVGDKYLWIVTTNGRVALDGDGNLADAQRLISNQVVVEGILGKDKPFTTPGIDELLPGPWGPNQYVPGGYVLHKARIISTR